MSVLVCIVHVSKIIEVIFVFVNQWLKHLVRNIILVILWWWLETSWAVWIDLDKRFTHLCIVTNMVKVLIGVVMV